MTPTELHNARFLAPDTLQQIEKRMSQYIIWNPASKLPPQTVIGDRPSAIKAAGRMAAQNPGETFFVCKLVSKAHKEKPVPQPEPAVVYTDLER